MRTILMAFLGTIFIVGCGRGVQQTGTVGADAAFTSYLQQFDNASKAYGVTPVEGNIYIKFGEVLIGEIGLCHPATLADAAYITIDKFQWDQLIDSERATLVFHELGHCVLHQQHRPDSIMNPHVLAGGEFSSHEERYVEELFTYGN